MIELQQVSKSFDGGRTEVVQQVDLHIGQGQFLVLLGESGCGKTTTLKMVNRLIEPTAGRIEVDGRDHRHIDPIQLRRSIGYVFQGIGLFAHMNVAQNIGVLPALLRWDAGRVRARVDELLQLVGLPPEAYRQRYPRQLSGGQQQRVGLARALSAGPRIMLMDEPFGALDPLTRETLRNEFARIHRQLGLTTVMVTHDVTEALLMADRIAVMRSGRLVGCGAPGDMMNEPPDDYVARLMQTPRQQADRLEALVRS